MRLLVYGSGEFGVLVRDLLECCGHEFAGYINDFTAGPGIRGTYEHCKNEYPPREYGIAVAIGYRDLAARWRAFENVARDGWPLPALIHPAAYVRDPARIGRGSMIMAGAIVDVNASVDEIVVLWPGVVLNHDSRVEANTFVSPNATICGFCTIGRDSFIGAGSVIVDHVEVPAKTFVRAGRVYGTRGAGGASPEC